MKSITSLGCYELFWNKIQSRRVREIMVYLNSIHKDIELYLIIEQMDQCYLLDSVSCSRLHTGLWSLQDLQGSTYFSNWRWRNDVWSVLQNHLSWYFSDFILLSISSFMDGFFYFLFQYSYEWTWYHFQVILVSWLIIIRYQSPFQYHWLFKSF